MQGDSGHRKDAAQPPLYPIALAAKPNTPLPPEPVPSPSPRQVPSPFAPQGTPQMGAPAHLCLPCAMPPPWAGAVKPFHGVHWHSSWRHSPMAQADPSYLPGLAPAYRAERKLPFSRPPVCTMQLGKLGPSGTEPAIPTSFPLQAPVAPVLPSNKKPQHLSH